MFFFLIFFLYERERERERDYDKNRIPTRSPLEVLHNIKLDDSHSHNYSYEEELKPKQELTGLEKAMKMLQKQGWKRGEGLGKSKQGMKGCLVTMGPFNQLVSVQDPSNVLRLQNMATKGNVDPNLKIETMNECQKFGAVDQCIIHESNNRKLSAQQQVSVFVKFKTISACSNAVAMFNGRLFDNRRVIASFFPLDRYKNNDFD